MRKLLVILIFGFFFHVEAEAARLRPESWYRDKWCKENGGKTEFVLSDKTRCDCLTETHAVEVEFGNKWAEAIGQALYYDLQTGKKAGVVLVIEIEKDRRFWIRLNSTVHYFRLPIDTWIMDVSELQGDPNTQKTDSK